MLWIDNLYGYISDLERSRRNLNWLAHRHAGARDQVDRLIGEVHRLRFRSSATEIMHPEWVEILDAVWEYGNMYEIPVNLVLSVIHRESNFDPLAASAVAYGPMQIHYAVWRDELNLDFDRLSDVNYNIRYGCHILRQYYDEVHDWNMALLLYNNGYRIRNLKYADQVLKSKFMGVIN